MPIEAKSLSRNLLILKDLQTTHLPDRVAWQDKSRRSSTKWQSLVLLQSFAPRLQTEDPVCNRKKDVYIDTEHDSNRRSGSHNFARHLDLFTHSTEQAQG